MDLFVGVINITVNAGEKKLYDKDKFIETFGSYAEKFRPFQQLKIVSISHDSTIYINEEKDQYKYVIHTSTLKTPSVLVNAPIRELILKANDTNNTTFCLELTAMREKAKKVT